MSLSTQTLKRLPTIKSGLLKGFSYKDIGRNCGVTEKTIDRDVQAWYRSGEYESWLWQEWLRLHALVLKDGAVEPYRQVTKLITKMITRKMEVKEEYTEKVLHVMVSAKLMKDDPTTTKTRA